MPQQRLAFLLLPAAVLLVGAPPAARAQLQVPAAALQPSPTAVQAAPGVQIQFDPGASLQGGAGRLEGIAAGRGGELRTSLRIDPVADQPLERLETRWQVQLPGLLQTLVVGDTHASGGGWSRPLRLGGLRFGRRLALRTDPAAPTPGPAIAPPPLPLVASLADDAAQSQARAQLRSLVAAVPAAAAPRVTAPQQLDAGASDYEVELGRVRPGWDTADADYGDRYAAGAWRTGLGARLTAEARSEWTPGRQAAGLELVRGLGPGSSVQAVVAHSSTPVAEGLRYGFGLVGSGAGAVWTLAWDAYERGFTPMVAAGGEAHPRRDVRAAASVPLWRGASADLSYTRQAVWDVASSGAVLGLAARMPVARRSTLSLDYALRDGTVSSWRAGLVLAVPLDAGRP